jgi:hypothetical protein
MPARQTLTEPKSGGGLLLRRRKAPLSRRSVAYFCSGAHTWSNSNPIRTRTRSVRSSFRPRTFREGRYRSLSFNPAVNQGLPRRVRDDSLGPRRRSVPRRRSGPGRRQIETISRVGNQPKAPRAVNLGDRMQLASRIFALRSTAPSCVLPRSELQLEADSSPAKN